MYFLPQAHSPYLLYGGLVAEPHQFGFSELCMGGHGLVLGVHRGRAAAFTGGDQGQPPLRNLGV